MEQGLALSNDDWVDIEPFTRRLDRVGRVVAWCEEDPGKVSVAITAAFAEVDRKFVASQYATIDEYISSFPEDVQTILEGIRQTIRKAAPEAEETISYQIPTFKLNGRYLVYFAGWKHHIGLYPIPRADEAFEQELSEYRAAKDTVRFPLQKPIPYDLIERVVALLVKQRVDIAE